MFEYSKCSIKIGYTRYTFESDHDVHTITREHEGQENKTIQVEKRTMQDILYKYDFYNNTIIVAMILVKLFEEN